MYQLLLMNKNINFEQQLNSTKVTYKLHKLASQSRQIHSLHLG